MKLSAPIHQLKRHARALKKQQSITMVQALDAVAQREGFVSWSLLQAKARTLRPERYDAILDYCNPGDLVLVGGRPMHGKTSFTIGLMAQAICERNAHCGCFSLDFIEQEVHATMEAYERGLTQRTERYTLDCSDAISAEHIIAQTRDWIDHGSVLVIDYLQLLDQKRTTPPLQAQVEQLKNYAAERRCTIFCVSQINRSVETRPDPRPTAADVHLPNPLDLKLFNKLFFLYRPVQSATCAEVSLAGREIHRFTVGWREGRFC
ncbi:MAG: DNA helicase [Myxococcota bacterium]